MSNLQRNGVKMIPVQLSAHKFEVEMVEQFLDPFGFLGRPREWVRSRVGPWERVRSSEWIGPLAWDGLRAWVTPRVVHVGAELAFSFVQLGPTCLR